MDLPSPDYIKAHSKVEAYVPPKVKLYASQIKFREEKARQRKANLAAGLTVDGKPRKNRRLPKLAKITDKAEYLREWRKLTGGKTKPKQQPI